MLLVTQVLGQFRIQRPFQNRLGQLLQQPVFPYNVFWLLVSSQQSLNQLRIDCHTFSFFLTGELRLHNPFYTLSEPEITSLSLASFSRLPAAPLMKPLT